MATDNNGVCGKKRKKLGLTLELTMMQLKRTLFSRNTDQRHVDAPARHQDAMCQRRARRLDELAEYADGLRRLDQAKNEHADDLERFLADADDEIAALRAAVQGAHEAYETRKRRFFESYLEAEFGRLSVSGAARRCATFCDAGPWDPAVRPIVDQLRVELDAIADGGPEPTTRYRRPWDDVPGDERRPDDHDGRFSGLWRAAVESMRENNRTLKAAADKLDDEMAELRACLSDATAEYAALDADKSGRQNAAIALDDFCAVTEQITAEQIRNMEFGRTLAVDDGQIAQQLNDIEQLKAKISKKRNKRRTLLEETDNVGRRLEAYKSRYEDLERRNATAFSGVDDDCGAAEAAPAQPDVGQRAKHLKQLKDKYNRLANRRDALRAKLQKQQAQVAAKSPAASGTKI